MPEHSAPDNRRPTSADFACSLPTKWLLRASMEPIMRRPWILITLLLIAPAHALTTREKLEKWCTSSTGSVAGAGRCLGYLLAAEDALSQDSIEGVRACLPENITLQEQNRIVIDWLKANPNAEAKTAMGLVARAYAAHYPCKR
jgi:hypothetical protein